MKKKLVILICLLVVTTGMYAQSPEKFSYQAIVRNASNALVSNTPVSIRISILQGNPNGTSVYSETHTTTTNFAGLISLLVGEGNTISGSISTINWGSDSYFIKTETDPTGGTNYNIVGVAELQSVPFGAQSARAGLALSADYSTLNNTPTIITTAQADKLSLLTSTTAVDLDQITNDVTLNTANAFPGFGTTAGTAFEILWSKINENAYYDSGKVGIGFTDATTFGSAVLGVKNGMVLSSANTNGVLEKTPGSLFYQENAKGFLFYYDNTGALKSFGTPNVEFNTRNNVFFEDAVIQNRVAIGEDATTGMDFGENDMVLRDKTISIFFNDTSNSASFPSNDWAIKINDDNDNGQDYFAVRDITSGRYPFRIMAGASDNTLGVAANGNVNIGDIVPTQKLEVDGTILATAYIGNGANLTNISTTGTASASNTGSTTIGADNDADTNGKIVIETAQNTRLHIDNDGTVNNGVADPSNLLSINGDAQFNTLNAQSMTVGTSIRTSVFTETTAPGSVGFYDLADRSIVLFNNANTTISRFIGGKSGQKVHLINIHPTNTVTITVLINGIITPGSGFNRVLRQNESITLVFRSIGWVATDYVTAP